jgi:hypothetical protein
MLTHRELLTIHVTLRRQQNCVANLVATCQRLEMRCYDNLHTYTHASYSSLLYYRQLYRSRYRPSLLTMIEKWSSERNFAASISLIAKTSIFPDIRMTSDNEWDDTSQQMLPLAHMSCHTSRQVFPFAHMSCHTSQQALPLAHSFNYPKTLTELYM